MSTYNIGLYNAGTYNLGQQNQGRGSFYVLVPPHASVLVVPATNSQG